jgi:hypothetical protein
MIVELINLYFSIIVTVLLCFGSELLLAIFAITCFYLANDVQRAAGLFTLRAHSRVSR